MEMTAILMEQLEYSQLDKKAEEFIKKTPRGNKKE